MSFRTLGGPNTLKTAHLAVNGENGEPQTPCVVVKGSGRASDVIACAYEFSKKIMENWERQEHFPELIQKIKKMVPKVEKKYDEIVANCYKWAVNCAKNKDMFTIIDDDGGLDTDDAILTALISDPHANKSYYERLRYLS